MTTVIQELGQLRAGPYTVRCAKRSVQPSAHDRFQDATCYAQNQADFYDTECIVIDAYGSSFAVRRGSGACRERGVTEPFDPRIQPKFHPVPEHPRSRQNYFVLMPPYVPPTVQRRSPTPDDFT